MPSSKPSTPKRAVVDQDRIDAIYLLYIYWQCEAFDDARKRFVKLVERLQKSKKPDRGYAERRIFAELQSMVTSAANISKLIWPSPGNPKATNRGKQLRALLNIRSNAVLQNKRLRNNLEHFDERLDSWAANPRDMLVSVVSDDPAITSYAPTDIFGLYNPKTYTLTVLGDNVNVDDLCNAVWGVSAASGVAFGNIQRKLFPPRTKRKRK